MIKYAVCDGATQRTQDGVDKAAPLRIPRPFGQLDHLVDDGVCRNSREQDQLIGTQPEKHERAGFHLARPSGGTAVGSLRCTLGASRQGGTPLLTTWPPAKVTNESGRATWSITAPTQPGTYTVQVSANGANHYSAWGFATVYVG